MQGLTCFQHSSCNKILLKSKNNYNWNCRYQTEKYTLYFKRIKQVHEKFMEWKQVQQIRIYSSVKSIKYRYQRKFQIKRSWKKTVRIFLMALSILPFTENTCRRSVLLPTVYTYLVYSGRPDDMFLRGKYSFDVQK